MHIKHFLPLLFVLFGLVPTTSRAQVPLITSTSQLSSPYSDSVEGTQIGNLIDNNTNTFWHSDWHNYNASDRHYIQVALEEPVSGLVNLYMHRRNATNDHPTRIVVSGSTDARTWKQLATIELPYQGFTGVTSAPWTIQESVSHIRLTVTDCTGSGTGYRTFWHAAEVQLYHLSNDHAFSEDLSGVRINEIQVANIDQFLDGSFNYGGWIELYNPGDALCSPDKALIRHTDADGVSEEATLSLGHGLLRARSHLCLWFDHNSADGTYGGDAHLQLPFKMDPEGGTLELVDAQGRVVDQVTYPPAIARCAYARTTDGGDSWGWTANPTPGEDNAASTFATDRLPEPIVSAESTLFSKSVTFRVDIPEGTTLYYTTDGSTPTATHGVKTTNGTFTAFTTKVYRFVLTAPDKLPSPVVTRTFIKDEHNHQLPVLHIATHPDHLYDPQIGVYTKGTNGIAGKGQDSPCNWNMDWDRPVNVEYFVRDTSGYRNVINQEAEFSIMGGWTRAYGGGNGWEMKSSFRLKSGKVYEGRNSFDYAFFGTSRPYNKYKALQVRNGGNDTYARFIDPSVHEIIRRSGFYVDTQAWQPCHVYFNGRYLGMLNIRENNNKHYGESAYGIDTDEMDQFELDPVIGYVQKTGTNDAFNHWLDLSRQLAANPTEENWQQIQALVDVDEYCNYMAAELYIGSTDWMTNCNNIKGFRSRQDGGRFHLVMFDTDAAFNNRNMINEIHNLLNANDGRFGDYNGKNPLAQIFFNMMAYEPFRRQFAHAFCIVDGSVMHPDWAQPIIDEMKAITTPALALEGNSPSGSADFVGYNIRDAGCRTERLNGLKNYLKQSSTYRMTIDSNIPEARLLVDGQEIPTRRFDGHLFGPFSLTAKAPSGYVFREWSMVANAAKQQELHPFRGTWLYYDKGSLDGTDWKSKTYTPAGWRSGKAPYGYGTVGTTAGAGDYTTTLDFGGDSGNKRPTYYFRKTVNLSEKPTHEDRFFLYYYVDDGALFYVNGTEVGSYNCRSGAPYNEYATGTVTNVATYGTLEIPASHFVAGSNTIAVEVHNTNAGSSDIFFDARLIKARFEAGTAGQTETIALTDLMEPGSYRLTAVFDRLEDPIQLLEAGAAPIRINEVSAGNDIYINEYFKKNDWIELYNTTDSAIDISGMYLSDNPARPQKFRIPQGNDAVSTTIPPYGRMIVWCDNLESLSQLHAPFKLDNADGASVSIQAADGRWADRMVYMAQPRFQTYGRYPDGGSLSSAMERPTIAWPNKLSTQTFSRTDAEAWQDAEMAITLDLEKGWNWTSHNLATEAHASRFTGYAAGILGDGTSYIMDEASGWSGNLSALQPGMGYKVRMLESADITLRGELFDTRTPVTINEGWNWVGCPLYNPTTLATALADYSASEGDVLVGLEGFSTFADGRWQGSLSSLSPGRAYLLRSGMAQSFHWTALSQPGNRVRRYEAPTAADAEGSPWTADIHAYPNVMSLIARLEVNGTAATADNYTLAAFCGDECRGVAQSVDGLLYLNIHGEGGEPFTFRLLDAEGQVLTVSQTLAMQPQSLTGSPAQPYLLTIGGDGIQLPTSAGSHPISVAYYHPDGRRIAQPTGNGVFLRKTLFENGHTITEKVLR